VLLKLIEKALVLGCGGSLERLVTSQRFSEVLAVQESLHEKFGSKTNKGIGLRAGHLNMVRLLNTLPEREALSQARSLSPVNSFNATNRTLVQTLGETIVSAADECLPDEAIALAAEWRKANVNRQIAIAQELYWLFRHQKQEAHGDLSMELVRKQMSRKFDEKHDDRNVLPRLYGKWDATSSLANCLGVCQMLVAFARRAGARVMTVSPLCSSNDGIDRARAVVRDEIVADLRARDLGDADSGFAEGIKASYYEEVIRGDSNFHVTVAYELCDGRWILVDPYDLVWGIFSPEWNLPAICQKLEKYQLVLPGLNLISHDHGQAQCRIDDLVREARALIERSRRIGAEIAKRVETIADLIDYIAESEDLDVFLRYDAAERREKPVVLPNADIRQYAAIRLMLGDDFLSLGAMMDPELLPKKIKMWITAFHATAANLIKNRLQEDGELIHSACEFSLPEFNLALSVLNSLSFGFGEKPADLERFFVDHSADQLSLNNVLVGSRRNRDQTLAQAAVQTLQALPFLHPLCRQKLDWFR